MKKIVGLLAALSILLSGCQSTSDRNTVVALPSDERIEQSCPIEILNKKFDKGTDLDDLFVDVDCEKNLTVYFFDVGQADACLLESEGHYMMIDAGNNDDAAFILNYLNKLGVKELDYVIGTHPHEDHIGSLDTVIQNFDVKRVYLPNKVHTTKTYEDVLTAISEKELKITVPKPGTEFYFNEMPVVILAPLKDYDDLNNNSIVLKVIDEDVSILFTGDMEEESENDVLNAGLDVSADILKVAHHGSDTSCTDSFINAVSPDYAVISVGKDNSYGHPSQDTVELLTSVGTKIFRTDEQGTVILSANGITVAVEIEQQVKILNETKFDSNIVSVNPPIENETTVDSELNISEKTNYIKQSDKEEYYIGNQNTKKFHRPNCSYLPAPKNQVELFDRSEAIDTGFVPCKKCNP